jgi:glycosyltransferase involved in cell wall biosynthesis
MQPLLSIVTVSLNAAATIEGTLASVALQLADFAVEHVCVDGGSGDGTRTIIDRWAERNPRIVRLYESDSGIFDAMNKGLRIARGEYLLFLNADDFLVTRDTLAQALSGLSIDPASNPDLIQGQFSKRTLLQAVDGFDARARLASDVTQFYELQRRFQPRIRRLATDVALMRSGGSANAGVRAMRLGTLEIYRHLFPKVGKLKATGMVLVKTLQSFSELRFGRCPHRRWFVE